MNNIKNTLQGIKHTIKKTLTKKLTDASPILTDT